ncbi:Beta-lactamase-like [Syntrophomonas zehnderi OL-4]|uniref:Beta-lactamase-like n=1 Tax=Syntrophomonas zehnderi OL-4 TaxID=690567 RepID=A0A0E4GC15_9FIRM|nr:MBL fold metallo-hydrolase [Syntrophomonas zehnderi]CFX01684.1 Beta-lactamase-like [Syntrophomonas zehnderi OL-4]
MQIHILASGSTGNATFIEMGGHKILIDAGISTRRIEQGLAAVGVKAGELDALLITHEHTDHIRGLDVLVRRYQMPVYARPAAWEKIPCRDKLPDKCCRELGSVLEIGSMEIEAFATSHDAADPVGFSIRQGRLKCVLATDLGEITPAVEKALAYADTVILEANHDPLMLQEGPYPMYLKKRISGIRGHLSNQQAGEVLARIPRSGVMQVFLAHLSQQNNHPRLALQTVSQVLENRGYKLGEEVLLHRTYPNTTASMRG